MYVLEHALLNLGKNKGRNILFGVMIFAIITATVVALAIFNTTGVIIEDTRSALQCAVNISPHMQTAASDAQTEAPASGGRIQAPASDDKAQAPAGGGQMQMIGGNRQGVLLSIDQYHAFAESDYLDGADVKESARSADGVDATYYLKSPDMLSRFEAELRAKGLPDEYGAKTDESSLEHMIEPVENLKSLSLTFLIIILVLGAVIMLLLSVIAVRERKYEIGVLRAMGMKKKKIALGLWTETIVITCICFVLAMGVGSVLSQPVSDSMMAGQIQPTASETSTLADRLGNGESVQIKTISISIDSTTALEIFGVSLLLASIAGIISVSRITKYEPIKILMERN